MKLLNRLWKDEAGFVVSAELVLVASVAVLAMVIGLSAARDGINSELADTAASFGELNQGYTISQITGHSASTAGTAWLDDTDFCENALDDATGADEACIVHTAGVAFEEAPAGTVPAAP